MIDCPSCGAANIPGVDECKKCGQPLSDLHLPTPASVVEQNLLKDRVSVLEPKKPITIDPGMPVRDVMRMMVDQNIGSLIVVQDGSPVGIFSERDALMKLNVDAHTLGDRPVSDFMTPAPETLEANAKLGFALQRMDAGGYRHLPIVDDAGKLTGMVSVRDILRYLAKALTAASTA
jgi:CBS domain-containing protein